MTFRGVLRGALVLAGVTFATAALDYFDIDEFECEQAVAHLGECCPELDTGSIDCTIGACDSADFDRGESECIQSLDCAAVEARGLCRFVSTESTSSTSSGSPRVCP